LTELFNRNESIIIIIDECVSNPKKKETEEEENIRGRFNPKEIIIDFLLLLFLFSLRLNNNYFTRQ